MIWNTSRIIIHRSMTTKKDFLSIQFYGALILIGVTIVIFNENDSELLLSVLIKVYSMSHVNEEYVFCSLGQFIITYYLLWTSSSSMTIGKLALTEDDTAVKVNDQHIRDHIENNKIMKESFAEAEKYNNEHNPSDNNEHCTWNMMSEEIRYIQRDFKTFFLSINFFTVKSMKWWYWVLENPMKDETNRELRKCGIDFRRRKTSGERKMKI